MRTKKNRYCPLKSVERFCNMSIKEYPKRAKAPVTMAKLFAAAKGSNNDVNIAKEAIAPIVAIPIAMRRFITH